MEGVFATEFSDLIFIILKGAKANNALPTFKRLDFQPNLLLQFRVKFGIEAIRLDPLENYPRLG